MAVRDEAERWWANLWTPRGSRFVLALLLSLAILLPSYYVFHAYALNHESSFPLDDPWIHLQFARNLSQYGAFSYFHNENITAGDTAPLYVGILAIGYFFTQNGEALSYVLGIVAFVLAAYAMYRLARTFFSEDVWVAFAITLLFVLDPWMNFFAVIGMETMLYIGILLACFYSYRARRALLLGLMLSLAWWTRPDVVVFLIALCLDQAVLLFLKKKWPERNGAERPFTGREVAQMSAIFFVSFALYAAMNMVLSGTVMTNTFGAKIAFYNVHSLEVMMFALKEYAAFFIKPIHFLLAGPLVVAVAGICISLWRGRYTPLLACALFVVGLPTLYILRLSVASPFARYLMPIEPFIIVLAVYGVRDVSRFMASRWIGSAREWIPLAAFLLVAVVAFSITYAQNAVTYQEASHYILDRQVAAGKWLKANTPEDALVATHDVGAIAYFSDRRIVDIAGLVSPEFIPVLGSDDILTFMQETLPKHNVTYVAFLPSWYRVTNQRPLFSGGDFNNDPMNIYEYVPGSTRILMGKPSVAGVMERIRLGQYDRAAATLNKFVSAHPSEPEGHYLLAVIHLKKKERDAAKEELRQALAYYPEYPEAVIVLADLYATDGKVDDVKEVLKPYLAMHPDDVTARALIKAAEAHKPEAK